MRRHLVSICAITAVACFGAAPAFSQDEGSAASSSKDSTTTSQQNMKNASDVTCAEITQLDMMLVPGVLYYVAGHEQAKSESGTDDMKAPKAKSEAGLTDSTAAKSDSTSADQDMKATDEGKSASSTGSAAKKDDEKSAASSKAGDKNAVPITGFYAIPVEEVMIACGDTPERRASEVVKEHSDKKMGASDMGASDTAQSTTQSGEYGKSDTKAASKAAQ